MSGLNIKSGCCCWCVFLGSALCSCFTAHGAAPIASFGGREGCVTNVCSCSHSCFASVSIPTQAPMWCYWRASPQTAPPSISTVTTWLWRGGARLPLKIRWNIPKVRAFSLCHYRPRSSWSPVDPVHHPTLCIFFFFSAENSNPTCVQIHAEVHKSLDAFASCLAKAIENDAKLTLFGEDLTLSGGIFSSRAAPRPRYLDGQRLRLESIDEGIVRDDRDDVEEDEEEKPAWLQLARNALPSSKVFISTSQVHHTWKY